MAYTLSSCWPGFFVDYLFNILILSIYRLVLSLKKEEDATSVESNVIELQLN